MNFEFLCFKEWSSNISIFLTFFFVTTFFLDRSYLTCGASNPNPPAGCNATVISCGQTINGTTNNGANNLWDGIRHCNVFLEHMPLEAGGPVNMEESERKQWIAEVKVLKAFFHYYLFTLYGPIPIVDNAVSTNSGVNEFKIYREPVDDVVNYIVETINEALPDLKNHTGVPISGGVYMVHIEVDGVGEKVLKWFGTMRPPDLENF